MNVNGREASVGRESEMRNHPHGVFKATRLYRDIVICTPVVEEKPIRKWLVNAIFRRVDDMRCLPALAVCPPPLICREIRNRGESVAL